LKLEGARKATATHIIRLLAREEVARDTSAFHFENPVGFDFVAGQYAFFSLIDPPETDDEGTSRSFSLASAPCEPDLMFATRMRNTGIDSASIRVEEFSGY